MDKTTVSTATTRFARPVARTKAYSVQMRGGSVRFQAQTLRKIRIPFLADLSDELVERLATLSTTSDQNAIDEATEEAFS